MNVFKFINNTGAQLRLAAEKFFVEHSHEADEYMRNIRFALERLQASADNFRSNSFSGSVT